MLDAYASKSGTESKSKDDNKVMEGLEQYFMKRIGG